MRCANCRKILRQPNKSGLCSVCHNRKSSKKFMKDNPTYNRDWKRQKRNSELKEKGDKEK